VCGPLEHESPLDPLDPPPHPSLDELESPPHPLLEELSPLQPLDEESLEEREQLSSPMMQASAAAFAAALPSLPSSPPLGEGLGPGSVDPPDPLRQPPSTTWWSEGSGAIPSFASLPSIRASIPSKRVTHDVAGRRPTSAAARSSRVPQENVAAASSPGPAAVATTAPLLADARARATHAGSPR
jgi:hypothetical protein